MPAPYQIIPEGSLFRPKIETHINDNTFVEDLYQLGGGVITSALFVFSSPKGRDSKVITITDGQEEFMKEFGLGPFSLYGQPLLNAYAAATSATGRLTSTSRAWRRSERTSSWNTALCMLRRVTESCTDPRCIWTRYLSERR